MSQSDEIVRQRLADVLDRSNIPTWVDTSELQAELFKVVSRLLKAERIAALLLEEMNRKFDELNDRDRGVLK